MSRFRFALLSLAPLVGVLVTAASPTPAHASPPAPSASAIVNHLGDSSPAQVMTLAITSELRIQSAAVAVTMTHPLQELTMVRSKFVIRSIERTQQTTYPHKMNDGKVDYSRPVPQEMHTIKGSPVFGNGDPNHENTKFWQASPSGSFELGTVNVEAVKQFKLGAEMYVDFTPVDG